MKDKAGGLTKDGASGQQALMEKAFHGSAGYASVLTNFLEGKGDAASMFKRVPIENNREGNEERTGSHMLQLLDIFSCDEGKPILSFVCSTTVFSTDYLHAAELPQEVVT
jgi:hypothetical protein